MAACGAAPSSARPTPTTTCAWSTTRCSASRPTAPRSSPRSPQSAEPSADFKVWTIKLRKGSKWSDGQPFGADDILFWYNDVLLNKELTPTLPGWIKNADGTAGQGREGRRQHGALHLRRAGHAVPDGGRQPGRRRPHLRDVPAGALPQEVPSRATRRRPTSTSWSQAAGFKTWTELFANTQRAAGESRASDHGRLGAVQPRQRSGLHAQAQSLLRRRRHGRQPAALHRRGALHLLRRRPGAEPGGHRRQLRHAGAPHPDDQLSRSSRSRRRAGKYESSPGRPSAAPTPSSPSTRPTRPIPRWAR